MRFEWAGKQSLPLPASNYGEQLSLPLLFAKAFLQLFKSFEPHNSLSRPGAGLPPPKGAEAVKGPSRLGFHSTFAPVASCLVKEELSCTGHFCLTSGHRLHPLIS